MGAQDDRLAIARVSHRLSFGPLPGEFANALAEGPDAFANRILQTGTAVNDAQDRAATPVPVLPFVDDALLAPSEEQKQRQEQRRTLMLWWLERMVTTRQPIVERMTWFWHGHWATSTAKVRDANVMLKQNETLRASALGDFTAQSRAMLKDPAMLIWLDGQGNRKGRPNENLGREFLELFTLGVGNYAEADVREAARALTGWRVDRATATSSLVPRNFDATSKTVLGVTRNFDADSLSDFIVSQPACASHLAQRMWLRLVSENEPSTNELAAITTAAGATRNATTALRSIKDALLTTTRARPLAKSPAEWAVALMRATQLTPSDLVKKEQLGLLDQLNSMGQLPFAPPSVGGWPTGQAWFTATSAQARITIAQLVAYRAAMDWLTTASVQSRPQVLADRLGVAQWSPATSAILSSATNNAREAFVLAANSPEFLVGV